ncbi:DUF4167 domain-containing protein [Planktotalea arctica]|uniref:DUF4167 domain-containing protein n=1 Tax=Planktotalea arctica TaxID=1481893 RepID=UPI000A173303|nr:DUF4167 domain-containing protein [Planktotalea arctica]
MRSSKPRSRKNNNRNRPQQSGGNVPNRVFDSSGPEGKVRGTPQQIIDKYQQLARDAQLAGDRVATENFSQHAEHYLRMLGAAQKEIDERREAQERENRERQAERDRERAERDAERAAREAEQPQPQPQVQPAAVQSDSGVQPDVIDVIESADSGLVETPESKPRKPRPQRKPRAPRKPASEQSEAPEPASDAAE